MKSFNRSIVLFGSSVLGAIGRLCWYNVSVSCPSRGVYVHDFCHYDLDCTKNVGPGVQYGVGYVVREGTMSG